MYLLDTNIVLHATRQNSPVSAALDAQFQLSQLPFRPAVCEVSIGELLAFARGWGERRRDLLRRTIDELLVIPIGREAIYLRWAELYTHARTMACQSNTITMMCGSLLLPMLLAFGSFPPTERRSMSLRGTPWVDVTVVDPKTEIIVP